MKTWLRDTLVRWLDLRLEHLPGQVHAGQIKARSVTGTHLCHGSVSEDHLTITLATDLARPSTRTSLSTYELAEATIKAPNLTVGGP